MKKTPSITKGSLVKLTAGGPTMAVNEVISNYKNEPTGSYRCQWFAGKKLEAGVFPGESLELVTPAPEAGR